MSDSSEEDDEEYPPWLAVILDEESEYYDEVIVKETCANGGTDDEWVEVKAIVAPDTADAASGKGPGQCRTYEVKRYTTILITSEPLVPPYIGLVDKVFRKRDAQSVRQVGGKPVYRLTDFGVQAYWFYRPQEVPETAWDTKKRLRKHIQGRAQYKLPGKGKSLSREEFSERQVLFSSHHTLHDYPDNKGILSMDGFLQACTVHWLGSEDVVIPRYEVHGSTLVRVERPGFVVRGFLWCASKDKPQLSAEAKEVHNLDGRWPDKDTQEIARRMCPEYSARAEKMKQRNSQVVARFHAARAAGQQTIASDGGEDPDDTPGQAGGKQAAAAFRSGPGQQVSSPCLEGAEEDLQPTSDEEDLPLAADDADVHLLLGE